jgi:hypothetical protein
LREAAVSLVRQFDQQLDRRIIGRLARRLCGSQTDIPRLERLGNRVRLIAGRRCGFLDENVVLGNTAIFQLLIVRRGRIIGGSLQRGIEATRVRTVSAGPCLIEFVGPIPLVVYF